MTIRHPADVDSLTHVFVDDLMAPSMSPDDAHHVNRVLRGRAGEAVTAGDGRGAFRVCRLDAGGQLVVESEVIRVSARTTQLIVAFAVLKGDKNDGVVQKLTELGIDCVIPFDAANSVAKWDAGKWLKNMIRFREIARHAAMQSRRSFLPIVGLPAVSSGAASFSDVAEFPGIAFAQRGGPSIGGTHGAVAIGPEGGWSANELAVMVSKVGIFDEVLRAETAAVVAAALMVNFHNSRQ